MEEVNANHLRFIRNPGGLLRKAVRRSDVGGASVQSTEDGKTFYCGHTDHSISVHTMGGITATASRDMTVRLWDVDTKECTAVLLSNEGLELTCVAIVSDTVLVTGDHRGELQVWDIQSGKIMLNIPGHTGEVNCVEPIGDGRQRVISGGNDGLLMVFSVETGECEVELKDHAASVMCCSVLTDTRVASGAEDGTIILWDVENGAAIWSIQGHERGINDMTYVHHLSLVLTASSDGLIKGWEITSECYASAAATNFGEGGGGGGGGGVRRGSRLALDHSQVGPMKPSYVLKGHAGRVTAVTKLTGTTIASGGLDCTLRLWNLDGECCVKVLEGHDDYIVSLCSFKSGTELLSTSHDASMGHWEERALAVDPACIATGIQNHTAPLRRHHKIDSLRLTEKDTLEIDEGFIGRGQFGEVKKGKFKRHQDEEWSSVAIKSCLFPEGEQGADFIAEIKMMRALQSFGAHENLVQMVAFDATEAQPQLILRLAEGGSLLGLLQSKRGPPRGLSSKELLGFVLDVCSGMVFISDHFFVHRDLAARNILIGERGVCKVCDFGLSQDISGDAFYRQASNPVVAWKWSSLETLMNGKSTVQSDVWSFGILMAEIITFGAKPYPGIRNAKLLSKLQLGFRMPQENVRHASPKYFALMHNTWRENANERPTFRELCHHIANIDDMIDDDAGASAVSKAMEDVIAGRTATYGQSGSVEMGVKWYVPYCPTNLFTGRKRELQEITKNLIKNQDALDAHIEELREAQRFGIARNTSESMEQTSFRVGICSYGGAGKTQLMLRYAWDNRQYYTGGVFWVEADTALRLRRGFINILAHLGQENIISNQNDHASVAKAAFQALSNVQGKWLLCVDAADREAEISLLAHCFIPSTLNCGHIVVTSRRSDATMINGMSIQTDCIVRLGMMSPSDASVYLYRAAKGMTTSSYDEILYLIEQLDLPEREALAALIGNTEKCGLDGLPLALEQAGAYILRTGRGFVYYRQFYERRMLELLDQQRAGKSRADGTDQDGRSVTTTWAINVADLSVEAKLVLDGIACFHPDRIPERVIIRLVSIIEEGDIIDNLEGAQYAFDQLVVGEMVSRFSLLTMAAENEGDRCYAIHRLMRLVVHARDGGVHRAEALTRALGALYAECRYWGYQTVVDASHKERERMFSLVPHIRSISNQLGGSQNIGMGQMVIKSNPKRRTSRALSDFSQERLTSSFNRSLHGLNHSGLLIEHATILRASGFIDQFTANYAGAIEAYEQALELLREATGEDDSPELAATLQQLGHVLTSKGDNSNAIIYYTQASDMLKRLHGEGNDHPSVAAILHRLATLLGQIDDWKGALKKFSESLEMKRRIHGSGKDHREIASSLHRIGNVHAKLGEYQLALTHYQASIDMYARLLGVGVDHAGIAFSYHDSGEVLVALGDTAAATKRFHTALHMRLRVYGKKPKESIAETALQLAQIYEANGNVEGAFEHYEIALGQYQRCFDNVEATVAEARSDHPKIAKILQQQAELHARAGSADAAITSYANARNMWTRLRDTSAAEICASAHDRLAGVANTVSINLSASSSDSTTPTPRPASTPTPTPTPAPASASASASALTPAPAIFPVLEPREEVPTKQILTYSSVTML